MPVNTNELLNILAQLADEKGIKVAVTGSLKGAAITGATTLIGGLLLGPVGLAFGGIAGGLTAASISRNTFRPVASVILEDMSPSQQALLIARVNNVLRDFAITDIALLLTLLQGNASLNEAVVGAIAGFLQKEMNLSLM